MWRRQTWRNSAVQKQLNEKVFYKQKCSDEWETGLLLEKLLYNEIEYMLNKIYIKIVYFY